MTTAILFDGDRVERLDALEDRPRRRRGSMLLWVDLGGPSLDDVRAVAGEFGLDDDTIEPLADPSGGVIPEGGVAERSCRAL